MPAITHIDIANLAPGSLAKCFAEGAVAVVIGGTDSISSLWRSLGADDAHLPWKSSLYDLSMNLLPHDDLTEALGDIFYFKPGRHSYIARKIEIRAHGRQFSMTPSSFRGQHGAWTMSDQLREQCWDLSVAVMKALAPPDAEDNGRIDRMRAVVQQLRYHDTVADHEALYKMMYNSLGGWGRIGYGLDRRREELRGPLARRGISDALALLSLLLPLRASINGLNRLVGHFDKRGDIPDGYTLLVKPHIDTRYFAGLCGSRHNLRTEVFMDGAWLPLPINDTDIAVLPGSRAARAYGIQPTLHRILQANDGASSSAITSPANITLLLGAK